MPVLVSRRSSLVGALLATLLFGTTARATELSIFTFSAPGSTFTSVAGVNGAGEVIGNFSDAAGNGHGFVVRPGFPLEA